MKTPLMLAAGLAALSLAACGSNDDKTEAPMAADTAASDASTMAPASDGAMAPSDSAMAPSSGAMAPSTGGAMTPSDGSMSAPVPPAPQRSASDTNDPATPPPAN